MNPAELQKNLTELLEGVTDVTLYTSMRDYIYARIDYFTEHVLSKNLELVLSISVSLLTLWILFQGFLIVTGRSQENLKSLIFSLGKNYIIILMALGFASNSQFAVRTLTNTLTDGISQIMTGSSDSGECLTQTNKNIIGCKIDRNLTLTQGIMGYMNKIDTAESKEVEDKVDKAKWFAGVGSAGPGVVAGVMLIMYRIAMALFIGFGPIFILCLLFKKTAPLFSKWLYYGLATIFSSMMLAVMADIAMDLTADVAATLFASDTLLSWFKIEQNSGIMNAATQQLGLGLILSTLLIVVPPMAGMWFNGVMGNFTPYSAIASWNSNSNQALPPHMDGGGGGLNNIIRIHHKQFHPRQPIEILRLQLQWLH